MFWPLLFLRHHGASSFLCNVFSACKGGIKLHVCVYAPCVLWQTPQRLRLYTTHQNIISNHSVHSSRCAKPCRRPRTNTHAHTSARTPTSSTCIRRCARAHGLDMVMRPHSKTYRQSFGTTADARECARARSHADADTHAAPGIHRVLLQMVCSVQYIYKCFKLHTAPFGVALGWNWIAPAWPAGPVGERNI